MLTSLLLGVLVLSAFLFFHSYLLYPASLWLLATVYSEEKHTRETWPHVALVIAAYNEEAIIDEKIENSLAIDYPGVLEVIVFSDASSDQTDEIVKQYANDGVDLIRIEGRVGKTACQNRVVKRVDADIVVFSDANSIYEPDAIRKLVEGVSPKIPCVVGELRYQSGGVEGESLYWHYERLIKRLETATGTTIAGNGAIYATLRSAYIPLASDEISDFAEPLAILQQGGTINYEPSAVAYERTADSVESELARRIRIATRSWHTLWKHRELLNPITYPEVSYKLWSHKLLRWLSPLFLGLILLGSVSLLLIDWSVVVALFVGVQLVCYLLAALGRLLDRHLESLPLLLHVPYYFVTANYGLLLGLINFIRGHNIVVWETDEESRQA